MTAPLRGLLSWAAPAVTHSRSTTRILFGDLRTGRITGEIDATSAAYSQVLNDAGSVDQVVVPGAEVRKRNLRQTARAARTFLAFEQDDYIQEAGPIWSRPWDWEKRLLTLGAGGLWSLFDHRKVIPVLEAGQRVQDVDTVVAGTDLGGIARALVAQAMTHLGGELPIVLPPETVGTRTETFPGWKLYWLGRQLRELTQREVAAPDIVFRPRRRPDDRRFIEWVMEVGTEAQPQLAQVGADWIFDTTVRKGPVHGIGTDEDAHGMGSRVWTIGAGQERDVLIGTDYDPALVDGGGLLLEQEETRTSVELQATLDGHAASLLQRSSRPIEVWKVVVDAHYAREIRAGHYAQVTTRGDDWLPDGKRRMRVQKKSGDLGDKVTLDMFPMLAEAV